MEPLKLLVPAAWMKACGYAEVDTIFVVKTVRSYGPGRTIVTVFRPDGREWQVWLEGRDAKLV